MSHRELDEDHRLAEDRAPDLGAGDHVRDLDEGVVQRAVVERSDPSLRHQRLPRVLHESPAAVLLVDLDTGRVVQANPAGRELTPVPPTLPSPVAAWSALADLRA